MMTMMMMATLKAAMFWKTVVTEAPTLTEALNKEPVELDEVLEDAFVLQELKAENPKLIQLFHSLPPSRFVGQPPSLWRTAET